MPKNIRLISVQYVFDMMTWLTTIYLSYYDWLQQLNTFLDMTLRGNTFAIRDADQYALANNIDLVAAYEHLFDSSPTSTSTSDSKIVRVTLLYYYASSIILLIILTINKSPYASSYYASSYYASPITLLQIERVNQQLRATLRKTKNDSHQRISLLEAQVIDNQNIIDTHLRNIEQLTLQVYPILCLRIYIFIIPHTLYNLFIFITGRYFSASHIVIDYF